MRNTLVRLAIVSSLISACARGDAATRDAKADTGSNASTAAGAVGEAGTPPRDSISDRADRGRIMGDTSAKVWLIMASDFQCPYCKMWHDSSFAGLMRDYVQKGRVQMAFLNFPLNMHPNAMPAAEAAMCASVQNKFWPLHESLFATQGKWEGLKDATPLFDSLATAAGVNMTSYRACVSKHLTLPLIQADRDRARQQGAGSTPTFIVVPGGTVLAGADANIRGALDAALAQVGAAKKP
jgi:protein-disulfide isomerase